MNWKRWKLGLIVACLTGFFGALVTLGVVDAISWKQFAIIAAVGIGKDALLFLKQHPIESLPSE